MKDAVALICIIIGVALVVVDIADWIAKTFAKETATATLTTAEGATLTLPGADVIKGLIDKAPRLGAALAFFVLGSILYGWLELTASVS